MALNDIYLIRDIQSYIGSQVLNIYFYRQIVTGTNPTPAAAASDAFQAVIVDRRAALQANALLNVGVEVINLRDLSDYWLDNTVVPATGDIVSQGTPPFVALSFRASRSNPGQRFAYKRIGGLTETLVEGNTTNASFNTAIQTMATALGATMIGADGSEFQPVMVARPISYGTLPTVLRTLVGPIWSSRGIVSQASRSQTSPP